MGDQVRGRADYLLVGDWNAVCSMCGRKRKASTMVKNWQGLWRCPEHNEPRQPQDFVRGVQDIETPPWAQPQTDIDLQVCTYNGCSGIPGWAMPGCSVPGRTAIQPVWGLFSLLFTSSVGALASGTLTEPIPFLLGTYPVTFADSETRQVTFDGGINASWTPALNPGDIESGYTNIGTY
jgi:hypothetical protein